MSPLTTTKVENEIVSPETERGLNHVDLSSGYFRAAHTASVSDKIRLVKDMLPPGRIIVIHNSL
jgi:hypothetical protein